MASLITRNCCSQTLLTTRREALLFPKHQSIGKAMGDHLRLLPSSDVRPLNNVLEKHCLMPSDYFLAVEEAFLEELQAAAGDHPIPG